MAAAKEKLVALADDARPGRYLVVQASNLMRRRPWAGTGLALLAGLALGVAPRRAVHRMGRLAWPLLGLVAGLAPFARFGVGAGRRTHTRSAPGRSR